MFVQVHRLVMAKGWIYEDNDGDELDDAIEVNAEIDAFKKEDKGSAELKRFNISANAVAGVDFKSGLYANAGYLLRLSKLAKEDKYKNLGIQLTVVFFIACKNVIKETNRYFLIIYKLLQMQQLAFFCKEKMFL